MTRRELIKAAVGGAAVGGAALAGGTYAATANPMPQDGVIDSGLRLHRYTHPEKVGWDGWIESSAEVVAWVRRDGKLVYTQPWVARDAQGRPVPMPKA